VFGRRHCGAMMLVSPWNAGTGHNVGKTAENVRKATAHCAQKAPCVIRTTRRDPVVASLERRRQDGTGSPGAARRIRATPDHTLQATALVNEAFLRFTDARQVRWQDRAHCLGIAARLMRRILVDHARARGYQKRGGGRERVMLDDARLLAAELPLDVVELDRALDAFAAVGARRSQVVELRFFGGLTVEETAEVLHGSGETIKRDWRLAKLWLLRQLKGEARGGSRDDRT
jgi:RNA polymerase sigma-70 factor (ECF subfamily)